MLQIHAALRLLASRADVQQATTFLTELGFKGLQFKSDKDNLIVFHYSTSDKHTLDKHLGHPFDPTPSRLEYKFGNQGRIVVRPSVVVLKNSGRNKGHATTKTIETHIPTHIEEPELQPLHVPDPHHPPHIEPKEMPKHEPEIPVTPKEDSPNTPGSRENDDSHVPVTHISTALEHAYEVVSKTDNRSMELAFLKKLWLYLNQTKFGNRMHMPNMRLMKKVSALQFRLRGSWTASKRLFQISPRLFHASQNFFVEVVLHEMCHQAVSEIDGAVEYDNKGHGRRWQGWMRHVGLNPNRFDPNDNTTYMTTKEKETHERNKREYLLTKEQLEKEKKELNITHVLPARDTLVTIERDHRFINVILVCPTRDGWAFLPELLPMELTKWGLVRPNDIYKYQGTRDMQNYLNNPTYQYQASLIRGAYASGSVRTTRSRRRF